MDQFPFIFFNTLRARNKLRARWREIEDKSIGREAEKNCPESSMLSGIQLRPRDITRNVIIAVSCLTILNLAINLARYSE